MVNSKCCFLELGESKNDRAERARRVLNVIQYRRCFLPLSETFIYAYIANFKRVRSIVVTDRRENDICFPHDNCIVIMPPNKWIRAFFEELRNKTSLDIISERAFKRVINDNDIRLIHAHFGPDGYYAGRIRTAAKIPLVCSFYGYDASSIARHKKWRLRYQYLFERGSAFIVEGSCMKERLKALGCPDNKLHLIRIGIDPSVVNFRARGMSDGIVKILFCGRFVEKKGLIFALKAIKVLNLRKEDVEFRIIGDGELRPSVLDFIKVHSLGGVVRLLGFLPHEKVREEMQNCDIIFQPSVTASNGDSEGGAPTILIEAQAAGMPVLSTYHADIPEIVLDGKSGLLAREGDVDDFAAKLQWLLENRDKWREMGTQGREHVVKQHNIHDQVYLLEELYYAYALR